MSQSDLPSIRDGRYRNLQVIGTGGMGIVYQAVDVQTGQAVALKCIKPAVMAQAPDVLARFIHEGNALRQLNHPNIVKVLDTLEENGQHYIVMEYVSGGSLADLLKKQGRLSVSQTLSIALEVADALSRAHHLKIIHRDIKPDNVLLAHDGTPRLSDFGVAHLAESEITQSGMVMGTYSYLCPEAFNGQALDARADIWAFGVMLFEMLAGQRPFEGESLVAIMSAVVSSPTPDLEQLCPDVPVALVDLIYRMLEKDRDQRIDSMRLVGAELEKLLRGSGVAAARLARQPSTIMVDEATSFAIETPAENEITPHRLHNLPAQVTPFVGREAELVELSKLLSASRLVTVLGPGGMGKTRLSLETATGRLGTFTSGVYFVALAPLGTAEGIVPAIAEAVRYSFYPGPEPRQQLLDYLQPQPILLILDNFEHLLDGASLVSDILRAAPEIKILVTSRERLNIEGETIFRLEGMDFPNWETPEDAAEFSAVKLFLQSARRVQPEFALSVDNLKYVARICRMVQGMPLGILLAAAWAEALPLSEIAQEIEKSLDFLETEQRDLPSRHRSLRAAFDYSWNLLGNAERDAFKKLSVFRGGFTREAAQQVADASLKTLMLLVNKSLLRRNAATGRYEVHELLRQYGEEQLDKSAGDSDTCRALHCAFFAAFLQQMWKDLTNRRQMAAFETMGMDHNNILVAWNYAVAHRRADLLRTMAFSLWYYGEQRLSHSDAYDLFARAAAALQMNPAEPDSRIALGLMLVLEGLLPFLSPRLWRSVFERATKMSDGELRFVGLTCMVIGLLLLAVWR